MKIRRKHIPILVFSTTGLITAGLYFAGAPIEQVALPALILLAAQTITSAILLWVKD